MQNTIEMYISEMLYGQKFLLDFEKQLKTLYLNPDFMKIINEIQNQCPAEENINTIEEIKRIAKTTLYNKKALFDFEALSVIVDSVTANGYAKNSALISVYCAMRIFELSDTNSGMKSPAKKPTETTDNTSEQNSKMDLRAIYPAKHRCDDGHYVRSKNEALVDNWLYNHFVPHAYEKAVYSDDAKYTYCSDFFLPQYKLFIEIWRKSTSKGAKEQPNVIYHKRTGYDILEISGDNLKYLDDILNKYLSKKIKKHSFLTLLRTVFRC